MKRRGKDRVEKRGESRGKSERSEKGTKEEREGKREGRKGRWVEGRSGTWDCYESRVKFSVKGVEVGVHVCGPVSVGTGVYFVEGYPKVVN